ncbi:MAG TPA: amino acid adenylation domain-containing protein [Ktedonobacteraceae bacterium]|nr:amino acid adenylation domain-containing protein [Ktedonobacteraceae bacterium]
MSSLGRLWLAGVPIAWDKLHADEKLRRLPLPTYPFERKRYWIDPPQRKHNHQQAQLPFSLNGESQAASEEQKNATLYARPELSTRYVAPRNQLEKKLATLWEQLLGVARIGVYDSFFELGGHSLLATQLVSRLRSNLQIHLPLRALFEATTIAELSNRLEEHADAQTGEEALSQPILPIERSGTLPLSYSQQRLWFLWQMEPGAGFFNIPQGLRLQGPLNLEVLEQSLQELIKRQEILRTTFILQENELKPVIAPGLSITIEHSNLQAVPASEQEHALQRLATAQVQQAFDLEHGPLWRVTLFRLDQDKSVLLITMHHMISDGWSFGIFIHELMQIYQAFQAGHSSPLEPLAIQYVDFAAWQKEWLQGAEIARQRAYWQQQLSGPLPVLELPTDHPRSAIQSYRGTHLPFQLPDDLTERLNSFSQQEHVTMFMLLLAAFQVVCFRYSSQEDILIGTPIANRRRTEIEKLIGCFINTLVIRTHLAGGLSFRALLQQVREKTLEAYAHQDLPFEQLVEALQPERDLSRSPIFQVMFMLQNVPLPATEIADLRLSALDIDNGATQFDLTLVVNETDQHLTGFVEYNVDLFEAETVKRLIEHWQSILSTAARDCTCQIADLPLMTEAERRSLNAWNATQRDWSEPTCVPQLFSRQVERSPDALALIQGDCAWTYDELNQAANRVARALHARGIGPGQLVGVCLERSAELVVALLGVHKAGAAYIPLDPAYPQERLTFMLTDSCATALLTQATLAERFSRVDSLAVISLPLPDHTPHWEQGLEQAIPGEAIAYVIYTSGSTGKPKGVMVPQKALRNCLLSMTAEPGMTATDRILAVTSFSFDIAALELLLPLTVGASIVIASQDEVIDGQALLHLLEATQVTLMQATPATWQMLLHAGWQRSLRLKVLCGGEALPQALAQQLCQRSRSVWNMYGPTETTIWSSTCQVCEHDIPISIGHPIANTQLYILDARGGEVPLGVAGELFIGGDGLAHGYWQRPALTAERFVPDPFVGTRFTASAPGARLYRTGDLVRRSSDGRLIYLNRLDFQVKIRGHRIELGEIEAKLAQHPTVRECILAVSEKEDYHARLVAFLILEPDALLDSNELRRHLAQQLPDYMIPSHFQAVERWPLTPNGKIDKKALLLLDLSVSQATASSVPDNAIEEILVEVWARILHRDAPGTDENFFDLGGHSLLATQLLGQVRTLFALDIPLRSLFEYPTIKAFARLIEQRLRHGQEQLRPPLLPVPREQPLLPSYAQQRLWFLEQLEPGNAAYHIPIALRIRGPLDARALEQSLDGIIQRHETLRTTFATHAGQIKLSVIAPLNTTFELSLKEVGEQNLQNLINTELLKPFDFSSPPLLRATLFHLEQENYVLLIILHHIASDGPSCTLLVHELMQHYLAFVRGEAPALPALPIQYSDFACWQRQWLSGAVLDAQLDYWKRQLADIAPLELPTDYPRPAIQTFRGADITFTLSQKLTAALRALSKQEGVTLFMTLLTAFQILLYSYTGQEDITVGTPITNRHQEELDRLIGLFINTLALRVNLSGNPTFAELLAKVRETCLEAYAHQHLSFEQIVDTLQPERDLSRSPLFQVMFVFQHAATIDIQAELDPLQISLFELKSRASKYDLTLEITANNQSLCGRVEYATDLFDASSIERLIAHWQMILAWCVDNASERIAACPLLAPDEYQCCIEQWNATRRDFVARECLHHLIEEQIAHNPHRPAVIFEKEQLSYRELNQRANQLAHYLQSTGIGPDVLVGVCLERSLELVISLLAVLKAGGAYVPFDPSYPAQRLAFMLEDSGVPVLLTDAHFQHLLPASQTNVICLDQLSTQLASLSKENPDPPVHAENLAYMIYTSGSTGTPKGAMNTHRAICNRLLWMQDAYHLTEADRVLQKTPFSFDVSVWEFFLPLLAGSCLVVASPDGHRDPAYLIQLIRERHITTLHFVPSMLQNFLEAPGLEYCQSLRRVICSGEALSIETQKRFFSRLSAELHNLYGPTEAAVDVTAWRCESESSRQSVPIGYPIANIQIYLLNKHLQPVPIGASGELHIGGIGLARGYWQRAGLTAERFIPDPFSQLPGARLYKTGDLARFLPDGAIEFQGRIDHQIKVRGFRIELGEIEAALTQHREIRECAVVVREDTPGVKRLIAYIVPGQAGFIPSPIALRDYLQQRLPDYMIPALFVPIEQLPLSPSGKLDRRALPPPPPIQPEDNATFTPPGTPIEQTLASIWAEVLGLERVSITDNFFALGGDSILSMQIIARAARANIRLTPKQIFRQQTIEALARVADAPTPLQAEQGIVEGPVPLTPIQHWFFEQKLADQHHWNQSALLQLAGLIDACLLEKAFEALFPHHDALRLRFTQCEAGWQQVNVGNEPVPPFFEQCNLVGQTNERQQRMIEETQARVQASLDLAHGSLLRVVFFDRGQEQPDLLLICIHHLIMDNVSWQILLDDLQIAYQALQQHVQPHFPPKTTSYQRWAEELVRYAQSEKPLQELDFWLEQNRGEVAPLPTDHNECNTIASTRTYTRSLSREETSELQEIATRLYQIPLSDIVLAMLALTFARWNKTDSVLIDAEGHGREEISEEIEVARTVGWFTSIYPLYLQLQHTDSESAALGKTRDRLCSLPQKGFNYGVLRYLLADLTLLKRFHELPSAEILFNYIGQLDQLISSAPLFKEIVPSSNFDRSPAGTRKHLFEIISGISNGQLYVDWRYSNQKHDPSTVERLATDMIQSLRNLLQQSRTEEARALLLTQHSHPALTAATPATIPLASHNQPLPLSFAQQRLWFLDQLLLENSLYNITRALRIQGPLQVAALKQSIAEIVRRHEALRTTFPEANGEAIQKIHPGEMAWSEIDLQHLAREERQMQAFALLQDEVQIPMDLANGPLIRLLLLKLSPEEHILGVTVHHIIFDVWSEGIFLRELLALYKAFSAGQPSPLAELPIQYADFAVWQRQRLQDRVLEEQMAYWRQHLHNASILELPTDHARKPFQSYKGAMLPFSFDKKLSSALAHLSQREGVTLFMTLLTGFMGLLRRYSGQTDIVVGTDIANRTSIETEQLIGFFVNLLILRGDLSGNPQFSHVLQQISNMVLNAYAHQDLPFEKLIEGLHLERDGNHIPLARVLFVFQNTPWVELNAEGLTLTSIVIEQDVTRFELAFFLWETPEGLKGTVNYSTDLFEATTIARIIMHFQTFLQHICTQPDIRLDSIKIHDEVDETNRRVSQLRKLKKAQRANK